MRLFNKYHVLSLKKNLANFILKMYIYYGIKFYSKYLRLSTWDFLNNPISLINGFSLPLLYYQSYQKRYFYTIHPVARSLSRRSVKFDFHQLILSYSYK
jgi:hypothetical protein